MAKQYNRYNAYQFDSKWEKALVEGIFSGYEYHPQRISYTKPATKHTYQPDWKIVRGNHVVFVEAKGRFRERAEYTKYLYVREALKKNEELVFLFMKPNTPMPFAQKRKDGTKRSHAEWADAEGFRWFDEKSIHILLGDDK